MHLKYTGGCFGQYFSVSPGYYVELLCFLRLENCFIGILENIALLIDRMAHVNYTDPGLSHEHFKSVARGRGGHVRVYVSKSRKTWVHVTDMI